MSKRHLSRNTVKEIGETRINRLIKFSEEAVREGKNDRARRYVTLARRIGMKTRADIPKDFKYCRNCYLPQIPGINCTVRLTGEKIVSTCKECGEIRRMPYRKEKSI